MRSKKVSVLLLIASMILSITGCTKDSPSLEPNNTETAVAEKEDSAKENPFLSQSNPIEYPAVLEQLNHDYIEPLSYCIPLDWKEPTDIYPDNLIVFYLVKANPEVKSKTEDGLPNYPQEEVEAFIQNYFDVKTDFLRTAQMYDSELKVYHTWGIGSAWESRVVAASEYGDFLSVDYEIFAELHDGIKDVTHGYGNVLMQKNPDNNGEYCFVDHTYHLLPIPESVVIGESH